MHRKLALALLAATAIAAPLPALAADDALLMVPIDVEGGGGTLFVTPHGKSVLIDTGNPDRGEHPNSENIDKTARAFGLKKIDYLITTHYHVDHIGGLEGLLKRIPIGTFIDHGANRELPGTQGPGGMIGPDWRTVGADGKPLPGRGSTTPPPPSRLQIIAAQLRRQHAEMGCSGIFSTRVVAVARALLLFPPRNRNRNRNCRRLLVQAKWTTA